MRGRGGARQLSVVPQQGQVPRVRLEVRRQPLAVQQLLPDLLGARLRGEVLLSGNAGPRNANRPINLQALKDQNVSS